MNRATPPALILGVLALGTLCAANFIAITARPALATDGEMRGQSDTLAKSESETTSKPSHDSGPFFANVYSLIGKRQFAQAQAKLSSHEQDLALNPQFYYARALLTYAQYVADRDDRAREALKTQPIYGETATGPFNIETLPMNLRTAVADLDTAIRMKPQSACFLLRSRVLEQGNLHRAALEDIERAIALAPTSPEGYLERANLIWRTGQSLALEDPSKSEFPEVRGTITDLHEAYEQSNEKGTDKVMEVALRDAQRAIAVGPTDPRGFSLSAKLRTYDNLGCNAAVQDLTQAIELTSRLDNTRGLADLYWERCKRRDFLGEHQDALADINKALDLSPAEPEYLLSRAKVYEHLGQEESAMNDYDAAASGRWRDRAVQEKQDMLGRLKDARFGKRDGERAGQ